MNKVTLDMLKEYVNDPLEEETWERKQIRALLGALEVPEAQERMMEK